MPLFAQNVIKEAKGWAFETITYKCYREQLIPVPIGRFMWHSTQNGLSALWERSSRFIAKKVVNKMCENISAGRDVTIRSLFDY